MLAPVVSVLLSVHNGERYLAAALDSIFRQTLDDLDARIDALAAKISEMERAHPTGIPKSMYPDYERLVAEHNDAVAEQNELLSQHRALRDDYQQRVRAHNVRVDATNATVAEGPLCVMLPTWLAPARCAGGE